MSRAPQSDASSPSKSAAVLAPARALMDRLSYPKKFALISILFALPLGVVMYLLLSEINDRIEFSAKEMLGDRYLRPLRKLHQHAGESHMLARAYAQGEIALRPDLVRAQAAIDEDLSRLQQVNQELGETLKTASRFSVLVENRKFLKERVLTLKPADQDALHVKFIADVRSLFSLVGDTSNLILDPDLDSYYLMDSILLKLPAGAELLAQARILGREILSRGVIRPEERTELIRLSGLMQSHIEQARYGMSVAFGSNRAQLLKPRLGEALQSYDNAISDLLAGVRSEIIQPERIKLERAGYDALVGKAQAANENLWERNIQALHPGLRRAAAADRAVPVARVLLYRHAHREPAQGSVRPHGRRLDGSRGGAGEPRRARRGRVFLQQCRCAVACRVVAGAGRKPPRTRCRRRAKAEGGGARAREGSGGGREPREEPVPGEHEP